MLAVAGLQRGLLRQLQHLHPARRPAMIAGEVGGELGPADVDDLPPSRPAPVQPRIHADDLPDRPLRPVPAGPLGEPHPKAGGEVVLQGGVVGLRRRDLRGVQDPAVDRQPPPGQGLHLVRDRDMGVQVRVAGAGVAVGERGGDQPGDVHLAYPARTLPGEQRLILDEPQRLRDRGLMGLLDPRRDRRVGERPQRRHRLHRGERQVVPPDRRRRRPGPAGQRRRQLQVTLRVTALLLPEPFRRQLAAQPGPYLRRQRRHGGAGPARCCGRRTGPAAPPGTAAPRSTAGTAHPAPAPDHAW